MDVVSKLNYLFLLDKITIKIIFYQFHSEKKKFLSAKNNYYCQFLNKFANSFIN